MAGRTGHHAQNSFRSFRQSADVTDKISGNIQAEIGDFLHFADYFFDSLFTDWMVYNKIAESQNKTLHTKKQIQDILDRLRRMQTGLCQESESLQRELEQVVINYAEERLEK